MKNLYLLLPFFLLGCKNPFQTIEIIEPIEAVIINDDLPIEVISSKDRWVESIHAEHLTIIAVASRYIGLHQRMHRRELQEFMGVDPVRVQWCAAFINAVLRELGIPGSDTVSDQPLTARSFLRWGKRVREPQIGDIVIFPRGTEDWQGHAGFYYGTEYRNGKKFYRILGGNQNKSVTIDLFLARSAISIRRYHTVIN
jgi:uncharacterized protein (TIGR02594 family)